MPKEAILGGVGVGSTISSLMFIALPYIQFLAALLGVVATGLAIFMYIRKIRSGTH